jgi:hypothetical protein
MTLDDIVSELFGFAKSGSVSPVLLNLVVPDVWGQNIPANLLKSHDEGFDLGLEMLWDELADCFFAFPNPKPSSVFSLHIPSDKPRNKPGNSAGFDRCISAGSIDDRRES